MCILIEQEVPRFYPSASLALEESGPIAPLINLNEYANHVPNKTCLLSNNYRLLSIKKGVTALVYMFTKFVSAFYVFARYPLRVSQICSSIRSAMRGQRQLYTSNGFPHIWHQISRLCGSTSKIRGQFASFKRHAQFAHGLLVGWLDGGAQSPNRRRWRSKTWH